MIDLGADPTAPVEVEIDGESYSLRPITRAKLREIRESVGLPALRSSPDGEAEEITVEQREALDLALYEWALADWGDHIVSDGEPVPCTEQSRAALRALREDLTDLLILKASALRLTVGTVEARDLGNSQGSSSGDGEQGTSEQDAPTPIAKSA